MTSLLSRLHRFIPEHYDLEELRTLCLDLGIKYDDLGGEGLSAKARELILWLGRRQQLDALLAALQQGRPGPFDKLGLGTDRVALDGLYAELPAFEASAGSIWRELWLGAQNIVAHHWPALLSLLVADGVLVLLYRGFRDRYLIRSWAGAGAVILATAAILGWYGLLGRRWQKTWLWAATLGTSLLFVGGLAWQVRQITQPAEFDPQTFGIAVALFGEGDSFRVTSLARDVTDQIYRGLDETIRDNPEWEAVQVRRVGLINREDQAREWGERVRADLVVWGQVVLVGTGNVSVHFEILQILDRVSSPVYPLVLPAQPAFA